MPVGSIVTVGASAGGVEALTALVAGLPSNLPSAVFVVLHIGSARSSLPAILTRAGPLPAVHPAHGETIVEGKIYVAPPDCHLLIDSDSVRLSRGPRENQTRPAINPLFRSAALAYGPRVTGVILTGTLDDGTAGLAEIKRRGGIAVVQDPDTAAFPSMPSNAIAHVDVDHIVPLAEIPKVLARLSSKSKHIRRTSADARKQMSKEPLERTLSGLTCPECRGPLWEERRGRIVEYRCRVGHAYSPLSMAEEHRQTVERTLWSTLVALEEAAEINKTLRATPGGDSIAEDNIQEKIEAIKNMLDNPSGVK